MLFSSSARVMQGALDELVVAIPAADDTAAPANRWSRKVAADTIAWIDAGMVVIALALTVGVVRAFGSPAGSEIASLAGLIQSALVAAIVTHVSLRRFDRYDLRQIDRWSRRPAIAVTVPVLGAFALVLMVGGGLGAKPHVPYIWYPLWALITTAALVASTLVARRALVRAVAGGRFTSRVAVYGSGQIGRRLVEEINRLDDGYEIAGVFDDRAASGRADTEGLDIRGGFSALIQAGRRGLIDHVIIALPVEADRRIATMALKCEQLPVDISVCTHFTNDFLSDTLPGRSVSKLGHIGLMSVRSKPLKDWAPLIKRAEDAILAPLFLILTAPIFAIAACAIRLDSPGPIFFRQIRHGLNHREIEVLKFRTMTVTENGGDVRQAERGDPRVTRVGRILRQTSIDELPQLINVLRGEMSLVGPRPHATVHNEQYAEMLERYSNRHKVKPGITGLAQVRGFRGETRTPADMANRVRCDLEYIDNWSIAADLRIIALTPLYGLIGRNAY